MTFDEVVEKIISTRSETHWQHGGLVHLGSRRPDMKTECGLTMDGAVYQMKPGHAEKITCETCDRLAPPDKDGFSTGSTIHGTMRAKVPADWSVYGSRGT